MKAPYSIILALIFLAVITQPQPLEARTWYITPDGTGDAPTIQAGVDSAAFGDSVIVSCGTYYDCSHESPDGKLACVILKSGVYLTSETGNSDCVTIDAHGNGRIFYSDYVDSTTVVHGFSITYGYLYDVGMEVGGGGIYCNHSSLNFINCNISFNWTDSPYTAGGGILCLFSSPKFYNCNFFNNSSNNGGGAISCWDGNIVFDNCTFVNNTSVYGNGAAIHFNDGTLTVRDCAVNNNSAQSGAGISVGSSQVSLIGSHIINNYASIEGGGLRFTRSEITASLCTISDNTAGERGGGILIGWAVDSVLEAHDSYILNNDAPVGSDGWLGEGDEAYFYCCDVDTTKWEGIGLVVINNDDCPPNDVPDDFGNATFSLLESFPNPLNPQTNITYTISQDGLVRLAIYDLLGRKVAVLVDDYRPAGSGSVTWDGRDASGSPVASGVYIARLETTSGVQTRKLVVAR